MRPIADLLKKWISFFDHTGAIMLELKAIGKGKALRFFEKAFSEGRSKTSYES